MAGLLADISIAGKSARIVDDHTRLSVAAGDSAVINWPLLCGMAKAKYHLLLYEPMDGEEAERIGMVSLCVADEALQDKALEVAERLRDCAPAATRWTKYALNNWYRWRVRHSTPRLRRRCSASRRPKRPRACVPIARSSSHASIPTYRSERPAERRPAGVGMIESVSAGSASDAVKRENPDTSDGFRGPNPSERRRCLQSRRSFSCASRAARLRVLRLSRQLRLLHRGWCALHLNNYMNASRVADRTLQRLGHRAARI